MYPLAISVINDPLTYEARKHAARKMIEGYYDRDAYRRTIRAITNDKARAERAAFNVKIKPAEITAQAAEVADYALTHERECIAQGYDKTQRIGASIRRWWDDANGNSYFSVWIRIPQIDGGFSTVKVPYQYGRDSHPEWETVRALVELGIFEEGTRLPRECPIDFDDQGYMKRNTL